MIFSLFLLLFRLPYTIFEGKYSAALLKEGDQATQHANV